MPKLSAIGYVFIGLFASYAGFFLFNVWTDRVPAEWFFKITVSYGVVTVTLGIIYLIRREFIESEQLKKDKYMD